MKRASIFWWMVLALVATPSRSFAAEADTFSPIISYQFLDAVDEPESGSVAVSPVASYLFLDAVDEPEAGLAMVSPVVSYQYFDWPGDENLTFQNSAPVSYFYNFALAVENGVITGTVTRSDNNQSLSGATVEAKQSGQPVASSQTGTNGAFTLAGLASGTYHLRAAKTDFLTTFQTVTVQGGATATANFALQPKPQPPQIVPAVTPPPQAVLSIPKSNARLVSFPGAKSLDPQKMTIVLTHGWLSTFLDWPSQMAEKLVKKGIDAKANIVAWDWGTEAVDLFPPIGRTLTQGQALGQALLAALRTDYKQPIHFIGHSLGTIVNAQAVEFLYSHGYTSENVPVHLTIFDEAEIANAKAALENATTRGLSAKDIYVPIPSKYRWADNYISLVGGASLLNRKDAVNILLWPILHWKNSGLDPLSFLHGYGYLWYQDTIDKPAVIGFARSFESDGLIQPEAFGTVFVQSLVPGFPFDFQVFAPEAPLPRIYTDSAAIGSIVAGAGGGGIGIATGAYSDLLYSYSVVHKTEVAFLNAYLSAIQSAGDNLADWEEAIAGTISSWTLKLNLRAPASPKVGLQGVTPRNKPGTTASFVTIPISIPTNTIAMTFNYSINGALSSDFLAVAIEQKEIFSIVSELVPAGAVINSGMLNVSLWQGRNVNLSFAMNVRNESSGQVTIQAISFYAENSPPLVAFNAGSDIQLVWPIAAKGYVLEETPDLAGPNWMALTNVVIQDAGLQKVLISTAKAAQFFRLRKNF